MRNFILIVFACSGFMATAQQLVFSMSAFGIRFGKMKVTKTQETDSTQLYTLHAKGYLKVLWMERSDETTYEVHYKNGDLISSKFRQVESGKLKKWTDIGFNGTTYQVNSHKGKRSFAEKPRFSVLKLYFTPLSKTIQVFSMKQRLIMRFCL